MINKIVGRILRLPRNISSSSFSTGGNGGKYGKPPSRPFFARRQEKEPQVEINNEKPQEPNKVINKPSFLRSMKKPQTTQSAKPQLRFRKKQTFDVGATEPQTAPAPQVKVKAEEKIIQQPALNTQQYSDSIQDLSIQTEDGSDFFYSGQSSISTDSINSVEIDESTDTVSQIQERYNLLLSTEETEFSKSDDSTEQKDTRKRDRTITLLVAQQLNQILTDRDLLRGTFVRRFSLDTFQINKNFRQKNWDALNQLTESYYSSSSALQIEREFHSYLIELDGIRYVQWFNTVKEEHKDLSELTLKKLYHKLLSQQAYKELKQILTIFKNKSFKLTYSSIQDLYHDIQTDSKSTNLEQRIKDKIDITRHILDVQFKNFKLHSNLNEVSIVSIDTWFEKLAFLALNRNIAVAKFLSLFQEIFSNHYDHVNLGHFYKNNLFFDVLSKLYFGSHISTQRIQNMFKDLFLTDNYEQYLKEFRESLIRYRSSTGKFAFPNAKGLKSQLQKSFQQQKLQLTLLNYVLLIHSDQPYELGQLMQKRQILLKYCEFSYHIRDILDDALFNLPSHVLNRRQIEPKPLERTVRRIHPLDDATLSKQQEEKLKERSEKADENNRKLEKMLMDIIHKQKATGVPVNIEKQYSKQRMIEILGKDFAEELFLKQQIQKMKQEARLLMKGDLNTEQVKQYYLNSQIPQVPHPLKGQKKWKDYQFQQQYRFKDPRRLGWDYNKFFISYYGTLVQQAQSQGNPYRKQLIRNILRADLRTTQQDIRRVSFNKYDNDQLTVDLTEEGKNNQYDPEQFEEYVQIRANEHGLLKNKEEETEEYMYQVRENYKKFQAIDLQEEVDHPLASAFEAKMLFDDLLKSAHLNDLFLKNGNKQEEKIQSDDSQFADRTQDIIKMAKSKKINISNIANSLGEYIPKKQWNQLIGINQQVSQTSLSKDFKKMTKVENLLTGIENVLDSKNLLAEQASDPLQELSFDYENSESYELFSKYTQLPPKDALFMWKNDFMSEDKKAKLKQQAMFDFTILQEITVGYLTTQQPDESWQDVDRYESEELGGKVEKTVGTGQAQEVVEVQQNAEGEQVTAQGQQAAEGQEAAAEGQEAVAEVQEAAEGQQAAVAEGEQIAAEGEQEVAEGEQALAQGEQVNEGEQKQVEAEYKSYGYQSTEDITAYQSSVQTCLQTPSQMRERKYEKKVLRILTQQKQEQIIKRAQQQQIQYQQKIKSRLQQQIPTQRPVKLFVLTKVQKKIINDDDYQVKNAAVSPNFTEEVGQAIVRMYKEGDFDKNRESLLRVDEEEKDSQDCRNIFKFSNILFETFDEEAVVIPPNEKEIQQKQQPQQQQQQQKEQKIYLKYRKTKVQQILQRNALENKFQLDTDVMRDSEWSTTFYTSDFVSLNFDSETTEQEKQSEKTEVNEFVDLMKQFNPVLVEQILVASGRNVNNLGALIKKKLQQKVNHLEKNQQNQPITEKVEHYEQLKESKDNLVRHQYVEKLVDLYLFRITKSPEQYNQFKQALKFPQKIDQFIKKYQLEQSKYSPSVARKCVQRIKLTQFPQVYDPSITIKQIQKILLDQPYSESFDSVRIAHNLQRSQSQQSTRLYLDDEQDSESIQGKNNSFKPYKLKNELFSASTEITDIRYLSQSELEREEIRRNEKHIEYQQNIQTTDSSDLLASQNFSELQGQVDMRVVNKQRDQYINKLAIKSAIKLKKYQLALALCRKIVMEPLIVERTTKNITFAVQKFLIDEHERERIPNFEDIIEHVPVSAENLEPEFLMSVHERCDSFDELIWNYVPPKTHKFEYWHTSLMFNRGQEIVKMDIANKLKDLKYERQYQAVPQRPKDEFIQFAGPEWRQVLLEQLGLIVPKKEQKKKTAVSIAQDTEDFKEKFFTKSRNTGEHQQQVQQVEAEGEVQGEEAVQEEQGNEQAAQEGEQVEDVQLAAEVQAEVQAEVGEVSVQPPVQQQESLKQSNKIDLSDFAFPDYEAQKMDTNLEKQYPFAGNFDISNDLRIRGYDFESFLKYSKQNIKPILEEKYETDKEYIKHMINLQALAEEARSEDSIYLQKRIFQDQKYVKNPQNIAIFASYGLWSYNFVKDIRDPIETRKNCAHFRRLFYQFKKYDGRKGALQEAIFNNQHFINFEEKANLVSELKFSGNLVDDLLIRRMKYFKEAEAVVRIQPSPIVEELLVWGFKADEPMAIYLAEKIAMITNQIIPHHIAQRVSRYLSHRHYIPAERIQRCKQALKVVGRINREHIYDFNREYDHITVRKHFTDHLEKRQKELDSSAVQFLMRVDPTHAFQSDTKNLEKNIKRSSFVV